HIAKCDSRGSIWSEIGGGIDGDIGATVYSLVVFDSGNPGDPALYVGGHFEMAGNFYVNNIVKRTTNGWHAMGGQGPIPNGLYYGAGHSLAVYDDDGDGPNPPYLYVAGGMPVVPGGDGVPRWDGTAWSFIPATLQGRPHPFSPSVLLSITDPKTPLLVGFGSEYQPLI